MKALINWLRRTCGALPVTGSLSAFAAPGLSQTPPMYGYHSGMDGHWVMSLIGILVIVVLVLCAAALIKYLLNK